VLSLLISYPASSALIAYSAAKAVKTESSPSSAAPQSVVNETGKSASSSSVPLTPDDDFYRNLSAARGFSAFMPQATETLTTYAANCTTPKTTFALGDTVCVKLTNAPLGPPLQRRLAIANPGGIIVAQVNVTSDPQVLSYTIPTTPTRIQFRRHPLQLLAARLSIIVVHGVLSAGAQPILRSELQLSLL
jgi:hypothetical protein